MKLSIIKALLIGHIWPHVDDCIDILHSHQNFNERSLMFFYIIWHLIFMRNAPPANRCPLFWSPWSSAFLIGWQMYVLFAPDWRLHDNLCFFLQFHLNAMVQNQKRRFYLFVGIRLKKRITFPSNFLFWYIYK